MKPQRVMIKPETNTKAAGGPQVGALWVDTIGFVGQVYAICVHDYSGKIEAAVFNRLTLDGPFVDCDAPPMPEPVDEEVIRHEEENFPPPTPEMMSSLDMEDDSVAE